MDEHILHIKQLLFSFIDNKATSQNKFSSCSTYFFGTKNNPQGCEKATSAVSHDFFLVQCVGSATATKIKHHSNPFYNYKVGF